MNLKQFYTTPYSQLKSTDIRQATFYRLLTKDPLDIKLGQILEMGKELGFTAHEIISMLGETEKGEQLKQFIAKKTSSSQS